MKRIKNQVLRTYEHDGYIVEITRENCCGHDSYAAYLGHPNIGIKEMMFGHDIETIELGLFIELVEVNLDEYIEDYKEEYE